MSKIKSGALVSAYPKGTNAGYVIRIALYVKEEKKTVPNTSKFADVYTHPSLYHVLMTASGPLVLSDDLYQVLPIPDMPETPVS
jgi:hypothetical protein